MDICDLAQVEERAWQADCLIAAVAGDPPPRYVYSPRRVVRERSNGSSCRKQIRGTKAPSIVGPTN